MNFTKAYYEGQKGFNKGLPMGDGLLELSKSINGIQKARIYGIAAAPKSGKSTFADCGFIIKPFIYSIENNIDVEWIYYSYEMDRISKEFEFACHFLNNDHKIDKIKLNDNVTVKGENEVELSSGYLMGRVQDDNGETIKVNKNIEGLLKDVYRKRIVPLFGDYDEEGKCIKKGKIIFKEKRTNPTGIFKDLEHYASENGVFKYETFKTKEGVEGKKTIGYKPNNPEKYTIIILDHLRKVKLERGYTLKQTVDKTIEYSVSLRNFCKFTFLHIIHLNRNMTDINRVKYSGDLLYPNSDDIKDKTLSL